MAIVTKECRSPSANPIVWVATITQGPNKGRQIEVVARLWIEARAMASQITGVEPGHLEVVVCENGKP